MSEKSKTSSASVPSSDASTPAAESTGTPPSSANDTTPPKKNEKEKEETPLNNASDEEDETWQRWECADCRENFAFPIQEIHRRKTKYMTTVEYLCSVCGFTREGNLRNTRHFHPYKEPKDEPRMR